MTTKHLRTLLLPLLLVPTLVACGGDDADGDGDAVDAGLPLLPCPTAPEFVTITDGEHTYDLFKYEASHPEATSLDPFEGAIRPGAGGFDVQAEARPIEPCSKPRVRPWHTVPWTVAEAACAQIDWRLCTADELSRACGGPDHWAFTFGSEFENAVCNIKSVYPDPESGFTTVAPSGHFEGCVSAEGAFDLSGNLWEWVAQADDQPSGMRQRMAGGWNIIPGLHDEAQQTCVAQSFAPPESAVNFSGFRCCRDAQ